MQKSIKKKIIESLIDQKEIFGDNLFEEKFYSSADKNPMNIARNLNEPLKKELKNKQKIIQNNLLFDNHNEEWQKVKTLDQLNKMISNCTKCGLHKERNNFVFGSGNPDAKVLVIGEGPGAEEDKQGLPFVGRAGKLLTDILKAIKFDREEVYIGNIVKCRPPNNRTPFTEEMDTCLPYLKKQIDLIKPKMILCLGLTAAKGLLKRKESLTRLRGKVFDFEGIKVMVTFHPAALLRNPNWKRDCWNDVQKFRKLYDEIC